MSILIKKGLLGMKEMDIYIDESKIVEIAENINSEADYKLDGKNKAVIPGLFNGHTHAAMALFRGWADDMPLQEWLETKIWPTEAKLTENDVYWGAKLACLEMIKSGTTFFNDMYWHWNGTARAVEEMGIRAAVSDVFIDSFDEEKAKKQIERNKSLFRQRKKFSKRVIFALGPHAIYTVSKESLLWMKEFAEKNNLLIHFHISETEKEVNDCIKKYKKRPLEYLDGLGFLGPNVIACHSVWLNDKEIRILAKNDVKVVHNPVSNMKLSVSGVLQYGKLKNEGVSVCFGTDGCASNNNLDMFEEMKVGSLLQKFRTNNPTAMPSTEVFQMATLNGAKAFGLNAGEIKEGKLADLLLIDLHTPSLNPNHNLVSNLVYSANGSCVHTMICDGKILMKDRDVVGETEIIEKAGEIAEDMINR